MNPLPGPVRELSQDLWTYSTIPGILHSSIEPVEMSIILSGTNVRFGLLERRSELLRCAAITKDALFEDQIAAIDAALDIIWDAQDVELVPIAKPSTGG